ncbi:glutamine amidotransferase [Nocardioides sp. zg-DK7169]|uniref:glutamine amidotransferase n=1 Tax=Nocardioides sp. zg-DK7169 TaxID=2736600 RepID=UPI00155789C0|nr:glutamine amidotransferase [Nocardioides sp. zg-DK7169]NPC97172.1 glutamine amidotransferase [Nocardioides sp. zg-DK7169]
MRPFLFLGTRPEDDAADAEYAAVLRCAGLEERDVRRVRLDRGSLADAVGDLDLEDWSGIVLGGGPYTVTDPPQLKGPDQLRAEVELRALAERVVEADTPFLGACYGIGTLGGLRGGHVDREHGEPIGAVTVRLTEAGAVDPLLGTMPPEFQAFVGHKEAVSRLPEGAVLLASSETCPVQAFRLGSRVYATQFHPELDDDGLVKRIEIYRHHGYFEPLEEAELIAHARSAVVTEPPRLLARFVDLFAR